MKITFSQTELTKAISLVGGVAKNSRQMPVLSNIRVAIKSKSAKISATDLTTTLVVEIECISDGDGELLIPASTLLEYLQTLESGEVVLSQTENGVEVLQKESRAELPIMSGADYPGIDVVGGGGGTEVDGAEFAAGIKWVGVAVADVDMRPELAGVLLRKKKNKLQLVGSDGFRLALAECGARGDWVGDVIVPLKPLLGLLKGVGGGSMTVSYDASQTRVLLSAEKMCGAIRVIQGKFPDFSKILPTSFATTLKVDRDDLFQAVKQTSVFARQNANILTWSIDGGVAISTQDGFVGRGSSRVDGKLEGDNLETAFNFRYLQDYLSSVGSGQITIGFNGPLGPVSFVSEAHSGNTHIIMPVKL